jgi:peptidyl-tRNA hydrolase
MRDIQKEVENQLLGEIYLAIGIDKPSNHDDIVEFIVNDVEKTADPEEWHSGDIAIGFRRFIESISE